MNESLRNSLNHYNSAIWASTSTITQIITRVFKFPIYDYVLQKNHFDKYPLYFQYSHQYSLLPELQQKDLLNYFFHLKHHAKIIRDNLVNEMSLNHRLGREQDLLNQTVLGKHLFLEITLPSQSNQPFGIFFTSKSNDSPCRQFRCFIL